MALKNAMGVMCSGGMEKDNAIATLGFSGRINQNKKSAKAGNDLTSTSNDSDSDGNRRASETNARTINYLQRPTLSGIGRASAVGLVKTVKVIGTIGNSLSYLNIRSQSATGVAPKSSRISVLAFEVANTITKGANLSQSLSEENIQFLRKEILESDAVQLLVSNNMEELLSIAADDKRWEFDIFAQEVIRFGNLCRNPLWHNLDCYFSRLDLEDFGHIPVRVDGEKAMQELTTLAQHTLELYHELHALDRFEQDCRRKLEEVRSRNHRGGGEVIAVLERELNIQRKLVKTLKKKSLWSRNLEEIMKKLVDVVTSVHKSIAEAFGNKGERRVNNGQQRLSFSGLALHYANIITQIKCIASRPSSVPSNARDVLFHGLPESVKTSLRPRLRDVLVKEEFSVSQVKAEINKTLQWLLPVATNTLKLTQTFGRIGEWANSSNDSASVKSNNMTRLQTLYHADKKTTEELILKLVLWLQVLTSLVKHKKPTFVASWQPISNPKKTRFVVGDPSEMLRFGFFLTLLRS